MTPPNPLGDRIRALRKERGLTLDQLAELSGSSKSYIWELENKNPPRPSADKLGTTIEFLLEGEAVQSVDAAADAHFFRNYQSMSPEDKAKLRQIADLFPSEKR
jgi:transcriptional regulator with XRE-family HTH domain